MSDEHEETRSWDELEQERKDLGDLMGSQEDADRAIDQAEKGKYEG